MDEALDVQTAQGTQDGEVELVATVTFRWTYPAKPSDYGTSDPLEMAAIDRQRFGEDTYAHLQGEPTITVAPVGLERVDVVLVSRGDYLIDVIKEVCWATGRRPREAKVMVEAAPVVVRKDVSVVDAGRIAAGLRNVGATVEIRPHGLRTDTR